MAFELLILAIASIGVGLVVGYGLLLSYKKSLFNQLSSKGEELGLSPSNIERIRVFWGIKE